MMLDFLDAYLCADIDIYIYVPSVTIGLYAIWKLATKCNCLSSAELDIATQYLDGYTI
jgi:hypothetical protein